MLVCPKQVSAKELIMLVMASPFLGQGEVGLTKHKRNPCLIGCLILFGALCLFCGFWAWVFEGADQVFSTPIKEWLVKRWLDSTYKDIFEITDDEKLIEIQEPEVTVGGTMSCVSAAAIQVFGTDRPYDEVVKDYTSWARKKGWKIAELPDDVKAKGVFEIDIPDNIYSRWFDTSQSFYIRPSQPEEQVDFKTVYRLELYLWEVRCMP
jgi:hypothetical protein